MAEKICQLCEEEQVGKIRNGRKTIPDNKMPDLGWDITKQMEVQEISKTDISVSTFPQTVIAIILLAVTLLKNTKTCILEIAKEIVQRVMSTTIMTSHSKFFKRAFKTYGKTLQAVIDMTRTTICNSHAKPQRKIHSHTQNGTSKQKLHNQYDQSYTTYNANTLYDNSDH